MKFLVIRRFYLNKHDDIYFTFPIFETKKFLKIISIIYLHIGNNSNLSYEISRDS